MQSTSTVKKYYRGSGAILFAPELVDGTISGALFALGNATGFGFDTVVTKETIRDFTVAAQPISTEAITELTQEVSFKGKELDIPQIKMLFLGIAATAITQTVGTGTEYEIAAAELDRYYDLGKRKVSNVEAVNVAVPLVEDVDFEVFDADRGIIKLLSTATVVEAGDTVTFTFDCAAIVTPGLPVIETGHESVRGRLFFMGDPSRGDTWDLTMWRCEASPDGSLALIGRDTAEFGIKFKSVLDPDHTNVPSTLVRVAVAA
jgi:hypothetical protein